MGEIEVLGSMHKADKVGHIGLCESPYLLVAYKSSRLFINCAAVGAEITLAGREFHILTIYS